MQVTLVNAEPAALVWVDDRLETVFVCSVGEGRIEHIHALRNPEKIRHLQASAGSAS